MNGGAVEIMGVFPFVLRLAKHEKHFFSNLLVVPPLLDPHFPFSAA